MNAQPYPVHRSQPIPRKIRWPDLEIDQILGWADAHYARTGEWPTADSGAVFGAGREKWVNIDAALRLGMRSLERGSSLARLLAHYRGVRNRKGLPSLTEEDILDWADAWHARTGAWPAGRSGPIPEAPGETWMAVDMALGKGLRGLPGGSTLAQLIAAERQVRNHASIPLLTEADILAWADAHHARTGRWPTAECGPIADAPGETWMAVNQALKKGGRGLRGGSSLARFLEERRGVPNRLNRSALTLARILAWAEAHRARTSRWPTRASGTVAEAPEEKWSAIDTCLIQGNRDLPGGSSLARLLAEHRGARRQGKPVRLLPEAQILIWADAHYARTGRWPARHSGPIEGAPGETWMGVHVALIHGNRGLPGGSSLARLLSHHRGYVPRNERPSLTTAEILAWADAYHGRAGRWPTGGSGPIPEAPGETWQGIDRALRRGLRGLPDGSSLCRLLAAERGATKKAVRPPLSEALILAWADAHHARTGRWPHTQSGTIPDADRDSWASVNLSLIKGGRGLPGGSTLARLLHRERGVKNWRELPPYSFEQILTWADAFRARHGRWPGVRSGPIEDAPGETWLAVEGALRNGARGLPGGDTLHRLIKKHREG